MGAGTTGIGGIGTPGAGTGGGTGGAWAAGGQVGEGSGAAAAATSRSVEGAALGPVSEVGCSPSARWTSRKHDEARGGCCKRS